MENLPLTFDSIDIESAINEALTGTPLLDDASQHILSDFIRDFLHLPHDFFVYSEVGATSPTGDDVVRFCIRAPKLEILTTALRALKVGLALGAQESSDLEKLGSQGK